MYLCVSRHVFMCWVVSILPLSTLIFELFHSVVFFVVMSPPLSGRDI